MNDTARKFDARRAAELLVDCMATQGTDRIFTVPGESFLPVLDALYERETIEVVACRQEGGAAFMACADGAMTGRPGIAFVTRGPGATNASIGVHVAKQDSQPMILFVGDVARSMRDREAFQEVDFSAFFSPIAKWSARIDDADRIPEYVARAYAMAMSSRPGPVVLALPEDMLEDRTRAAPRPRINRPRQAPDRGAMKAMMAAIAAARRPVAIIGGAGWTAQTRSDFQTFAERAGLPVATAFRRQDAISPRSGVYAGNLGYGPNPKLAERVRGADLILAVGARLGEATTDGYALIDPDHEDQFLIHVHPEPEELGRVYRTDLAICAGVEEFSEACASWEVNDLPRFKDGETAHREWEEWATPRPASERYRLDVSQCVYLMSKHFPADSILCNGAGNFSGWWHRFWRYDGYPSMLAPTCGAMGYGLPAAIAASLRFPDRKVVALAGDGDFLMNGQEMATAAQQRCNLTVLVIDNGSYGTIRMHQEREFPGRVCATDLGNPDFAALARSFGAWAKRVETTAQFAEAIREASERDGLKLIHCLQDIEQLAASGATISGLRAR